MPTRTPRSTQPVASYGVGIEELDILFFPAGSGAPTGLIGPHVASVARTSQGLYTLTFNADFKPNAYVNGYVHVRDNANLVARIGKVGTVAPSASPVTATVYVLDDALAVQDITANAASYVRVCLKFKMNPVKDAAGLGGL